MKKLITNIITITRIVLAISLLFVDNKRIFLTIYLCCGISDILDGFIARKIKTETEFGKKLDSIADLIFVIICLIKLIPIYNLTIDVYILIIIIVLIRIITMIISYIKNKNIFIPHTILNKITGIILFITPIVLLFINLKILIYTVCILSIITAIYDMIKSIRNKKFNDSNKLNKDCSI